MAYLLVEKSRGILPVGFLRLIDDESITLYLILDNNYFQYCNDPVELYMTLIMFKDKVG